MKTFKVDFLADENFDSTNIVFSATFKCKSITTAFKLIYNYFPENFSHYKLYDNGICREFLSKEKYLKYYNL